MSTTDWKSISDKIESVRTEIFMARDGDGDDVLNVCELLLSLIEQLNDRDAPR